MDEISLSCQLCITCNYVSYSASETLVKYISHSREISAESESPQPARSDQFSITATRVSLPFPPSSRTRQVFLVFHDLCQTWRRSFLSGKFRHQGRICSGIQLTSLGLPPTPSQAGLSCPFYKYYQPARPHLSPRTSPCRNIVNTGTAPSHPQPFRLGVWTVSGSGLQCHASKNKHPISDLM